MNWTNDLLEAARKASDVHSQCKTKDRIQSGFTRIDPAQIAADAGITIMFKPLEKLLGAFLKNEGQVGIIINVERPPGLIHMTCAHELGHFFLNHPTTTDLKIDYDFRSSMQERQADVFGYYLLAPSWLITHIARIKNWTRTDLEKPEIVYQLSLRLGISFNAAAYNLARLKFIPQEIANQVVLIQPAKIKKELLNRVDLRDTKADVWLLDKADQNLIIEPRPNDTFIMSLPSHASSGYEWSLNEAIAEGFTFKPLFFDTDEVDPKSLLGANPSVGITEQQRCLLYPSAEKVQSLLEKRFPISLIESQPWETISDSNPHYKFSTEYESLREGLSSASRRKRIAEIKGNA